MVKLYYANIHLLQEPDVFDRYLEKMNMQRRAKVLRCKQDTDKMRSLLAGVLLRHGLEKEGLCYEELSFSQNTYGKPVLEGVEKLYFSVSHSGDYVICGIADHEIGVDIEDAKRPILQKTESKLNSVARKSLSSSEYALFENADDKVSLFLKLWTRKESYSKAIGRGLGMDFSQIDVLSDALVGQFWSDWLKEDYYVSIYLEAESVEVPVRIEWKP